MSLHSQAAVNVLRLAALVALALGSNPAPTIAQSGDLTAAVARMARVGRASSPTFSPDGRRIAFVSDLTGVPQIWIVPVEGGWPTLVTADNDPVGGVAWSPAGDWLAYTLAPGGGMNTQVYVVKPDGSGQKRLTPGGKETNRFFGWTRDGLRLALGANTRNPAAIDAYLVDPLTANRDLVVQNDAMATLEDVSPDRRVGLVSRLVGRGDNNLYLVDFTTRRETLLTPHTGPGTFSGELAPDGRTVYLVSNKDRDLLAFARIRVGDGGAAGPIEPIAERADAELDAFTVNEQGTLAALVWNVAGKSELSFVDLASGTVTKGPELPAELAGGLRFSRDGTRLALTISGAAAPPDVWVMDMGTKALRQVTRVPHVGVDLSQLVRPELARFSAHDGLELSGWLYRPKGQAGPAPYVISFHGGPEGQERPAFRSEYQALLQAGIGGLRAERPRFVGLRKEVRQSRQRRAAVRWPEGHQIVRGLPGEHEDCGPEADWHHWRIVWRLHDARGAHGIPGALCRGRRPVRHGELLHVLRAHRTVDGRDLDHRIRRSEDAGRVAAGAVAAGEARSDPRTADGPAWRQRHQRAGGRGGTGGEQSEDTRRARRVRPVSG
jgi:Tol biopolymer transport system component